MRTSRRSEAKDGKSGHFDKLFENLVTRPEYMALQLGDEIGTGYCLPLPVVTTNWKKECMFFNISTHSESRRTICHLEAFVWLCCSS